MPQWRADGSCLVIFTITHVNGDGSRTLLVDGTSLSVSYVVPSPLAQLSAIDAPKNCSFSLAVDANIVSPQSESYSKLRGTAHRQLSFGREDEEGNTATVEAGSSLLTLNSGNPGRGRVLSSTCIASGWQLKDDVLMNEPVGTPLPLAVDIEITPSLCQRESKEGATMEASYPECAFSSRTFKLASWPAG